MKIGVITFHNVTNYGAMLQALASQENLKKMGYDAEIIDYTPADVISIYQPFSFYKYKKWWNKSKPLALRAVVSDLVYFKSINKKNKAFSDFGSRYYNLSPKNYKKQEELKKDALEYDVCITGSDQVWNPDITYGFDSAYFLDFGKKNMVRASYAASIGRDSYSEEEQEQLKGLLKSFDSISMREETAAEIIAPFSPVEPCVAIDPTLLLSAQDWKKLFNISDEPKEEYIFVYTLMDNPELNKYVEMLSEKTGLPVKTINKRKVYKNETKSFPGADPEKFVGLIANARYVVTNSFHGTAFSVNLSKDFITFKSSRRNSRITDLLGKLGISERAVAQCEDKLLDLPQINYDDVQEKLQNERDKANEYIKSVIEKAKR